MRKIRSILVTFLVMLFLFSCSKEESTSDLNPGDDTSSINFGIVLNDVLSNADGTKQSLDDIPECSDAVPAYVAVVLTGTEDVGSMEEPVLVPVSDTPGDYDDDGEDEYFTLESPDLELDPGDYVLQFFAVYDSDDNLIWIAPSIGGDFENFVDFPLPLEFTLNAGTKKYLDVEVLCYDKRMVNEYGYLFFELETYVAIDFCVFGNFCDESGRHFLADYSVSIWYGVDNTGAVLYTDVGNTIETNNDGEEFSDPVCFAMPDTNDEDTYYIEITMDGMVIRSFTLTDSDLKDLFDGEDSVDYYHFREGDCNLGDNPDFGDDGGETCEDDPAADCDMDGVPNINDDCPNTSPGIDVNDRGCEDIQVPGRDVVVFNDINIFKSDIMADVDNVRLVQNLVNYVTEGSRNDSRTVWIDRGRGARCNSFANSECDNTNWSTMRSVIEAEGFSIVDIESTSGSINNIPSEVKIVFLVMPTVNYTVDEINTLKAFAAEGGRIVFVGEWEGFYNHIPVENQFLASMGAVLRNTGGSVDCNPTIIPSTSNRTHPIMLGIDELTIACASVIEPGPGDFALFYDTTNTQVLAGVAKINTAPITEFRAVTNDKRSSRSIPDLEENSSTGY